MVAGVVATPIELNRLYSHICEIGMVAGGMKTNWNYLEVPQFSFACGPVSRAKMPPFQLDLAIRLVAYQRLLMRPKNP